MRACLHHCRSVREPLHARSIGRTISLNVTNGGSRRVLRAGTLGARGSDARPGHTDMESNCLVTTATHSGARDPLVPHGRAAKKAGTRMQPCRESRQTTRVVVHCALCRASAALGLLMEAAAAVVCRGGGLRARARARAGGGTGIDRSPRARRHGVGVAGNPAPPATARRRLLLVASLGIGEPLTAQSLSSLGEAEGAAGHEVTCGSGLLRFSDPVAKADHSVQVVDDKAAFTEILPPPDEVPTKTVHVKFVLQKQCAFGQRFLVVGDDPALGLWNPAKAIALDWSEDHVWTAKKELTANRSIEFKFLLQDPSGQVHWQHGHNRILQVADTSNTLVVIEDWDEAKTQKVSEEAGDADVIISGCNGALQEDELQTGQDEGINKGVTNVGVDSAKSAVVTDDSSLHMEMMGTNGATQPQLALDKYHKIPDELTGKPNMAAQDDSPAADYAGRDLEDAILHKEGEPEENWAASVFENGMAWARKALQQLLLSLGSQIDKTKT
ncbi:hypothetical protein GUJ93_ZPchr0001g29427 [Zizania palustris]|uniref:CBM20 domain-containing protein n=1 Tax=Zizania palustris TaxID=103762 RepID=A0A8J5RZ67_ZIZPA|nr:hypothetical protein GUJ93_ZPchr0001g29427 [Zizania palustris]